jgi:hypothetical protein
MTRFISLLFKIFFLQFQTFVKISRLLAILYEFALNFFPEKLQVFSHYSVKIGQNKKNADH